MKEINNIQLNEKGYYYDFNIPDAERTYKNLADHVLFQNIDKLEERYGLTYNKVSNYWFQQYIQGSDFGWHHHNAHWAMVYYVELPETTTP